MAPPRSGLGDRVRVCIEKKKKQNKKPFSKELIEVNGLTSANKNLVKERGRTRFSHVQGALILVQAIYLSVGYVCMFEFIC